MTQVHTLAGGPGAFSVLVAAVLWGTTGTAAAFAPTVPGLTIGAAAMGIGGLLQAAVAAPSLRAHREHLRSRVGTVTISAAAVAAFPLAFYSSMRLTGVAIGTVVTIGSAPPAAALIERVMDGTTLSRRWILGTIIGIAGVLALASTHPPTERTAATVAGRGAHLLGIGLGLLGGTTYALYSWGATRTIRSGTPARATMGAIFGLGAVLLMPVLLATGTVILSSSTNIAVTGYLAVVPMFLGYVLFGQGITRLSASTATTLSLAEPAAAAVIAMFVLHEHLNTTGWAGLSLLFASLLITTTVSHRPARQRATHLPPHPTGYVGET